MNQLHKLSFTALVCMFGIQNLSSAVIPKEISDLIPREVNLDDPKYAYSKKELEELLTQCGPGIVEGAKAANGNLLQNRCSFNIKLDDVFFEDIKNKTGLLPEENWAYQDNVSFVTPSRADVPESFDLRDLMKNGEPVIRKQQCGDCWAWSTHHGLEIARAVHDGQVFDHSIQTVLSCSKAGSCSGGYMSAVGFLTHGLPLESEFPYAASNKACKFNNGQITDGWDGKVMEAPYVGSSFEYSRGRKLADGSYRPDGSKVSQMIAAMYQWQAPLVVTVSAYDASGNGVVNNCSAINSGGNHMVAVVGWDSDNGARNAHVWNSWGTSHGQNGVSRLKWECGSGKLNRGLGVSARVLHYKAPCTPPNAGQIGLHEIKKGGSVQIGAEQPSGTSCQWTPSEGLDNPTACVTNAHPDRSTEYHLNATSDCGNSSSMTLVDVWGRDGERSNLVMTPFGLARR